MKIMIISTVGLTYDGITSVILSYLKAMDKHEIQIYVASSMDIKLQIKKQIEDLGCTIVALPSRKKHTAKYMFSLCKFLRKNKIDTVHAHGNSGTLAIEMVASWLGGCKKRIAHSHNTKCDHAKVDKLLRPILNISYTDAMACGDEAGKWLFKDKPFTILPNGRNTQIYKFDNDVRESVRKKYQLSDKLVIGHVGGFYEQKNHKFLIEIFREILKTNKNAVLMLIGEGPLKKEIEELVIDIKSNIIFVGTTNDVSDYLQAMDVMIFPSLFEGVPLVVIEWQLAGLPSLISQNISKECIFTDSTLRMSLQNSAKDWADKILVMANQMSDREKNSKLAIDLSKKYGFDIEESARKLKKIYTEM